ncbi:MAG: hypothetical protein K0Q74_1488, partial [Gammaproteobacteria bacterium]|nr:hypothetical protein [Gammaproteobacteria bacterium]
MSKIYLRIRQIYLLNKIGCAARSLLLIWLCISLSACVP